MGIRESLGKAMWGKLSWSDRAAVFWVYARQGAAAAVIEATKRAARNTFTGQK